MADMLVVATFKFSNPVLFFVKVKADNPFLHVPAKRVHHRHSRPRSVQISGVDHSRAGLAAHAGWRVQPGPKHLAVPLEPLHLQGPCP